MLMREVRRIFKIGVLAEGISCVEEELAQSLYWVAIGE